VLDDTAFGSLHDSMTLALFPALLYAVGLK